jgi:hypothetical protein
VGLSISVIIPTDDVIEALAQNVDRAYATMLVEREIRERCLEGPMSLEAAMTILRSIENRGGAAGIAARLASLRLTRKAAEAATSGHTPQPAVQPRARIRVRQVIAILVGTLGPEVAEQTVAEGLAAMGLQGTSVLDEEQAIALLDRLATNPSLTAIARFAKVRLLMVATRA